MRRASAAEATTHFTSNTGTLATAKHIPKSSTERTALPFNPELKEGGFELFWKQGGGDQGEEEDGDDGEAGDGGVRELAVVLGYMGMPPNAESQGESTLTSLPKA